MQVGGGINADNCISFLDEGASHVIVTSVCVRILSVSVKLIYCPFQTSLLWIIRNQICECLIANLQNDQLVKRTLSSFLGNSDVFVFLINESVLSLVVLLLQYVFSNGQVDLERLEKLVHIVGKHRLVLDLSCRKKVFTVQPLTSAYILIL